jgi:protein-S-isoprenylcysteine O-methyltransferase Ste14
MVGRKMYMPTSVLGGFLFIASVYIAFPITIIVITIRYFIVKKELKEAGEDYREYRKKVSQRLLWLSFAPRVFDTLLTP